MTLQEDITVQQGATFQRVYAVTGVESIAGFDARMQVRQSRADEDTLADWSVDDGQITVDGVNAQVVISVPASETAAMDWQRGVYDLELESDTGVVWRLAEGSARLSREVTR